MKMIHLKHKSGTKVDLHFKGLFVGEESVGLKKREKKKNGHSAKTPGIPLRKIPSTVG